MNSKKNIRYFITLATILTSLCGCITEEEPAVEATKPSEAPSAAAEPPKPETPREVIASPISSSLIDKFNHLSGFEGEVLIGNGSFHAILAGVPLTRKRNAPYKGIHAMYQLQNGAWNKVRIWDSLKFERTMRSAKYFTPIGLNVENSENHSVATLFFTPAGSKLPQISLKFHVFADHDWIVLENDAGGLGKKEEKFWRARWSSLFGEQIVRGETESESPVILRYFEDETVAYVGPIEPTAQIKLLPDSRFKLFDSNNSVASVSHLFIGLNETKDMLLNASLHKKCMNSFKVTGGRYAMFKSVNIDSYVKCVKDGQKIPQTITLRNTSEQPTRSFLVNERSQKLNYLYFPGSSELKISSQRQNTLQVENAISTSRSAPVTATEPSEVKLEVNDQGLARVLGPKGVDWSGPTLVRLQSHIAPNSIRINPEWTEQNLGVNLWRVNGWPLEMRIESGYYRLEAYNLHSNKSCNAIFEVKKDLTSEVICQVKSLRSGTGFAGNFELPQMLHKMDNYTDLNGYQVAPQGSDLKTRIIWATSTEYRLKFRIYPVDKDIIDNWAQFKKDHPTDSTFNLLGQFSQRLGDKVTRELLCPYSDTSEVAYLAAIRRVKPNALQIFGCDNLEFSSSLAIDTVRKLNGTLPVILPATNNNPLVPLSGFASFIGADGSPQDTAFIPDSTFASLSYESRYTLSQGALLKINTPITNTIASSDQEQEVSFDIEVKSLWPFQITGLEVQQSDGSSFKRKINIEAGEYAITKFRTKIAPDIRWMQVHLTGRIIDEYPGLRNTLEKDRIIASSAPLAVVNDSELSN